MTRSPKFEVAVTLAIILAIIGVALFRISQAERRAAVAAGEVVQLELRAVASERAAEEAWAAYEAAQDTARQLRDSIRDARRRAQEAGARAESRLDSLDAMIDDTTQFVPRALHEEIVEAARETIRQVRVEVETLEADTARLAWNWRRAEDGWRIEREARIDEQAVSDGLRRQVDALNDRPGFMRRLADGLLPAGIGAGIALVVVAVK